MIVPILYVSVLDQHCIEGTFLPGELVSKGANANVGSYFKMKIFTLYLDNPFLNLKAAV